VELTPTSSSAEVKEREELNFYSPFWAFVACSRTNFTFELLEGGFRLQFKKVHKISTVEVS
jgi:hypothetical protein